MRTDTDQLFCLIVTMQILEPFLTSHICSKHPDFYLFYLGNHLKTDTVPYLQQHSCEISCDHIKSADQNKQQIRDKHNFHDSL